MEKKIKRPEPKSGNSRKFLFWVLTILASTYLAYNYTDILDSFGESRARHIHIKSVELDYEYISLLIQNTSTDNLFLRKIYFESSCTDLSQRIKLQSEYEFTDTSLHLNLFANCYGNIVAEGSDGVSFSANETRLVKLRINHHSDGGRFFNLKPHLVADDGTEIHGNQFLYYSGWPIENGLIGRDIWERSKTKEVQTQNYIIIDSLLQLPIDNSYVTQKVLEKHNRNLDINEYHKALQNHSDSVRKSRTYLPSSPGLGSVSIDSTFALRLLKEGKLFIDGLGTFSINHRTTRQGRNPETGKTISIQAKNIVKFKASEELIKAVNNDQDSLK